MGQFISKIPSQYSIPVLSGILGLGLGYFLSPSVPPRSKICALDIQALRDCKGIVDGHHRTCAESVFKATQSTIEAQQAACNQKIQQSNSADIEVTCAICKGMSCSQ